MKSPIKRIEEVIKSYVTDGQFMGAVLVAQFGQIILNKGFGYANIEWQIPNTPTTKFRIASLTKQFTAAAILLLEEKRKLKISDTINTYMPDAPKAWDKVTIFHLLNHSSGIPSYTGFPDFMDFASTTKTPKQQIDYFRHKPLNFEPGSDFEYNNSGYVLLGYLIEIISEQSYEDFIVNHIMLPLKMHDSGYDSHSRIIPQRASGYMISKNGLQNADFLDMSIPYSAGSLFSTTQDLLKWQQGLFKGRILSSDSLKNMIQPFINNYGFGVRIHSIEGFKTITHAGGTSGFNTKLIYCPDDQLTVIVLANLNAIGYIAQDLAFKITSLAHKGTVKLPSERKEILVSNETLTKYVGTYNIVPYMGSYGLTRMRTFIITIENGHLVAEEADQHKIRLFAESETSFFSKIPDIQLHFINDKQDKIVQFQLRQDGEDMIAIKSRQ